MNKFVLEIVLNTMGAMPQMVTEIRQTIKDAEASGENPSDKIKTILADMVTFLDTVAKVV